MSIEEIAQWVIDNRYPKSEQDKLSDFELYNGLVEKMQQFKAPKAQEQYEGYEDWDDERDCLGSEILAYKQIIKDLKTKAQEQKPIWVKASERLPEVKKQVNGKLKGNPAIIYNNKLVDGYITANGNLERIEDIEWLDEQPTQKPITD